VLREAQHTLLQSANRERRSKMGFYAMYNLNAAHCRPLLRRSKLHLLTSQKVKVRRKAKT